MAIAGKAVVFMPNACQFPMGTASPLSVRGGCFRKPNIMPWFYMQETGNEEATGNDGGVKTGSLPNTNV